MTKTIKLPEGDIVIGSKEEAFWNEIKENTKADIERLEKLLKFNRAIVKMAEEHMMKGGISMDDPTEKQLKFAKSLGIEKPEGFSKQALKEIISKKLEGQGKKTEAVTPKEPEKTYPYASKREFHLSPEQVRTNALDLAIKWATFLGDKELNILECAGECRFI